MLAIAPKQIPTEIATAPIAQWAEQSSAGAAVAQMALRFSSGDSAVAKLVREQQDLAATWARAGQGAHRGAVKA